MRRPDLVFGLLNIHKPVGPTSHDIVAGVRRGLRERRVGHAGTLDPLAEGVLLVAVGEATRLIAYMGDHTKTYRAEVTLGVTTDTYDAEGEILTRRQVPTLTEGDIEAALAPFRGAIQQVPPIYSAIKVGGKSAHARARAGEDVQLDPRPVTIHRLTLIDYTPPRLTLEAHVSAGTYIRSLAHDLGEHLGCGAMLSGLVRTAVEDFTLEEAVRWADLTAAFDSGTWNEYLLPAERALPGAQRITVDAEALERLNHGRPLEDPNAAGGLGLALAGNGDVLAVLEGLPQQGAWQPRKVFRKQLDKHLT